MVKYKPSYKYIIPVKNMKTPSIGIEMLKKNQNSSDKNINSNLMLNYMLKALVTCLCLFGCFWQIAQILRLYFSYPTTVYVNVSNMDKLRLPGITLCNNNRLMMSKLKDYDSNFQTKWSAILNHNSSKLSDSDIKLQRQALIDGTLRNMMKELPVSTFMEFGHTDDHFIVKSFLKCATDSLNPDKPCLKYANIITTSQELGNCFTLFHKSTSNILGDMAIDSGLSQSPVKRGKHNESINIEQSIEPFHPNEVLRMKVNFHAEEYTTLNEPVLGHIIVHDIDEIPVVREKSFLIQPGHYYEFYINRQMDQLLPLPYSTDCVNHDDTIRDSSNDFNEFLHNPISKDNCIIGCMAQNTMDKCNCWPPELPFIKGTDENSQENSMKWCDWDSNPPVHSVKPENMTWFQFCFSANENGCNRKCKSDCSIDRYQVKKEGRTWPQTERIEHDKTKDYLFLMRTCCAIVSIRYWSSEIVINKYEPKFEIAEITSYIGGLLSMWVGFSLLSVHDFIEAMTLYIYKYLEDQRKDTDLNVNPLTKPTVDVIDVYDQIKINYDQQYRNQFRRNNWRKKAKVSAIIDRISRTPSRESPRNCDP